MTIMSQIDRNAFALTESRVAELKQKEAAARIVHAKAIAEFEKAQLAYAKNFTPIILALIASTGSVTRSDILSTLVEHDLAPSDALADNIIRAHILDGLLYEYRAGATGSPTTYKATSRYANLAPA